MDSIVLLAIAARICIGCVLLAAGASKAMLGTASTGRLVEAFQLAPRRLVPAVSVALPCVEIGVGAAMFAGVWVEVTDWAAITLMAALTAIAGITVARGLRPTCGCFGRAFEAVISPGVVVRNMVLIAVLAVVLRLGASMPATLDATGLPPLLTVPAVLVAAVSAATFMFRRKGHAT